jgi:septal ring factor EnvC (AmiA/AmiB activator)
MAASNPLHATEQDPCVRFIRAAQQLRERIRRNTEDARELRATIVLLQAADQPDEGKIQLLEKELNTVERQIHDGQTDLQHFEFEISLNC